MCIMFLFLEGMSQDNKAKKEVKRYKNSDVLACKKIGLDSLEKAAVKTVQK
jgi:hypothetical protein